MIRDSMICRRASLNDVRGFSPRGALIFFGAGLGTHVGDAFVPSSIFWGRDSLFEDFGLGLLGAKGWGFHVWGFHDWGFHVLWSRVGESMFWRRCGELMFGDSLVLRVIVGDSVLRRSLQRSVEKPPSTISRGFSLHGIS
jgi:hypothetical protein